MAVRSAHRALALTVNGQRSLHLTPVRHTRIARRICERMYGWQRCTGYDRNGHESPKSFDDARMAASGGRAWRRRNRINQHCKCDDGDCGTCARKNEADAVHAWCELRDERRSVMTVDPGRTGSEQCGTYTERSELTEPKAAIVSEAFEYYGHLRNL